MATVATQGLFSARMRTVVWAWLALDIEALLVPAFDSISKCGFSFHLTCIRCQISFY